MKKLISLVLAAVMVLSLAACGSKAPAGGDANVDLKAFADKVLSGNNAPAMVDMVEEAPDMVDGFFPGLSDIETKQLVVKGAMITAVAAELVLVEVANSADVETVKGILEERVKSQTEGAGAFYPATIEAWEQNSRVVTHGNYVCLFVYENVDQVVSDFEAQF